MVFQKLADILKAESLEKTLFSVQLNKLHQQKPKIELHQSYRAMNIKYEGEVRETFQQTYNMNQNSTISN